ncbi:sensor histidine kinase [Pelomonas sp. APW6]|uniref:histidine kinase n=1 Tax=Roseateles subflavus TaxID=3053353 RepID=A0ABT7LNF4_9BURK|nr:sensor histidine kinase [Pelomonas sp. APW6]MDL5034399.1 sensor histidine kinase [Pelomonas sp. APW6]
MRSIDLMQKGRASEPFPPGEEPPQMTLEEAEIAHHDDIRHSGIVLFILMGSVCFLSVLAAAFDTHGGEQQRIGRLISWSVGLGIVGIAAIIYRKYGLETTARVCCFGFLAMIFGTAFSTGMGFSTSGIGALTSVVVISGTLGGSRTAMATGAISTIGLTLLFIAQSSGMISGPKPGLVAPLLSFYLVFALSSLGAGWLLYRHSKLFWRLVKTLGHARDHISKEVDKKTAELKISLQNSAEANSQVQMLLQRLHHQIEDERARMRAELHDAFGAETAAMSKYLSMIKNAVSDGPVTEEQRLNIARTTDLLSQSVDKLYRETRRAIKALGPELLDRTGLGDAVSDLVDQYRAAMPQCSFSVTGLETLSRDGKSGLENGRALTVWRLVQEALTNVSKHADAGAVVVDLRETSTHLLVTVSDDGKGFDNSKPIPGKRLGLASLHERARALAGKLDVKSAPGAGTSIHVAIPIEQKD